MLNKKIVSGVLCISIQLLLVACSLESQATSNFTQINNDATNESNLPENSTDYKSEVVINEEFCKELIRRLIADNIHIKEGNDKYFFSERYSQAYIENLKDSDYYIIDINGDGILDIGIKFPTNVLTTYIYEPKEDALIQSIGLHMYTEILGEGQHMTISSSAYQTTYFYDVMVNGKRTLEISFGKELVGMSPLEDGTEEPVFEFTVNSVQVTQEQWELLSEPLWELQKNAPPPFKYEDVMNDLH